MVVVCDGKAGSDEGRQGEVPDGGTVALGRTNTHYQAGDAADAGNGAGSRGGK